MSNVKDLILGIMERGASEYTKTVRKTIQGMAVEDEYLQFLLLLILKQFEIRGQ
jgi:hypothetical protein